MKRYYFTSLFWVIISAYSFAQKIPQDYIFIDGDTIYGYIHGNNLKTYLVDNDNFTYHNLKKVDSFVYNKKKYKNITKQYYDGIYSSEEIDTSFVEEFFINHSHKERRLPDYIVKENNDTIYGPIYQPIIGKSYLMHHSDKIKITAKTVKSYRFDNKTFQRFKQIKKKGAFYEQMIVGPLSLYGITTEGYHVIPVSIAGIMPIIPYKEVDYYVLENDELYKITELTRGICNRLFRKNPRIWNEMKKNKLHQNNLPLIVEYYNILQTQ